MQGSHQVMSGKLPKPGVVRRLAFLIVSLSISQLSWSMGLRSFVALPVEKGGQILRLQMERNDDSDVNTAIASLAYGLSGKQTLMFGLPYQVSPGGSDQLGDLSALYRHIVWQVDAPGRTSRLGLLGGAVIPTESGRDGAIQAGAVATFYRGRYAWDLDVLYQSGRADRPDAGRYDISWQYRLTPAEYPDWGLVPEWDVVLELGGRYSEGRSTTHQATGGLQWVHRRWVLEGGLTKDLNGPRDRRALLSFRWHF